MRSCGISIYSSGCGMASLTHWYEQLPMRSSRHSSRRILRTRFHPMSTTILRSLSDPICSRRLSAIRAPDEENHSYQQRRELRHRDKYTNKLWFQSLLDSVFMRMSVWRIRNELLKLCQRSTTRWGMTEKYKMENSKRKHILFGYTRYTKHTNASERCSTTFCHLWISAQLSTASEQRKSKCYSNEKRKKKKRT